MAENNAPLKDKVVSGLVWIFGERILAQGVSFLVSIILARILMPEEYGIVALVLVFLNIADVFVSNGFGESLVQKQHATETDFSTVFYCSFAFSWLVYAVLFASAGWVADYYANELLCPVLRVLALKIPLASVSSIQHAYVSKHMILKKFFFSSLGGTLLSGGVGIAMALGGCGVWALGVEHLVYASSSSVYGSNTKVPYSTDDKVDDPVSLYAATKKRDELLAHAYAKLYEIPCTGLRFFTVYGPAGRPDMAYFGFTDKLGKGQKIQIFNSRNCQRDFTYIDDIVEGVVRVMQRAPQRATGPDGLPLPPYKLYNIGNNHPENLLDFVDILQQELVRAGVLPADYDFAAHKELVPMQPGDVPVTYADTAPLERDFGFKPATPLREGLRRFAVWYKTFYLEGQE